MSRQHRPIRVTLLSADADPVSGGWGRMTYDYTIELAKRREVEVKLLLPEKASVPRSLEQVVEVSTCLRPFRENFRRRPDLLVRYLVVAPDRKTDVVHSLVEFPYALTAARLANGRPYLVTGHGTYSVIPLLQWPEAPVFRYALRKASAVVVPSQFTAEAVSSRARLLRPPVILHNGVDVVRFSPAPPRLDTRLSLGIPDGTLMVLSVGALKRRKGQDILIRAFAEVASKHAEAHLVVVGSGEAGPLQASAASLGLAGRVHITGQMNDDQLLELFRACDIFALLPRREHWNFEGFGLVFLEAGACGKPVLGTSSGGVPDAVLDGETGLLVPEDDVDAAALGLERLVRDQSLRKRMGEAGLQWARQHSWAWYTGEMIELYRRSLADSRPLDTP